MIRAVIRWLTDDALADAIAGDLAEERARRAARGGPARASGWHAQAMLAIGGHMLRRHAAGAIRKMVRALVPFGRGRGDLRHAARSLRRAPWHALTVIAVVALSMALAVTVFSVVDGVLFRPLPYPDAHELRALSGVFDDEPGPPDRLVRMVSPRELNAWRQSVPDLRVTLLGYSSVQFDDGSFARAVAVDPEFFDVFGVRLHLGGFDESHFVGEQATRPIVISHALWTTRFGGDTAILGRTITPPSFRPGFPSRSLEIVGVLDREGFVPPLPGSPDDWVRHENRVDAVFPYGESPTFGERIGIAFARVEPERVAATEAALEAAAVAYRSTAAPARPVETPAQRLSFAPYDRVALQPMARLLTTRQRPILALVFVTAIGLTLLVLLNVGALAAARAQRRLRELALRRSLGARSLDLLRSALAEQALLVAAGAALGLAAAPWLLELVERQLPAGLNLIKDARIDWRAAAFAVLVSAAMTFAVAALSVRFAVRHAALSSVLAGGQGPAPAQARLGRLLVAGQLAIAFALVLGGVMFLTSLGMAWREDPGLRVRDAVLVRLGFGEPVPPARENEVAASLRSLPGVSAAGAFDVPMLENITRASAVFRDPEGGTPDEPRPALLRVGSGYFDAAAIRLLEGRYPTDAELESGAPVIVVSQALAERYWPNGGAVGQTLRAVRDDSTVVGVVSDIRAVALDVAPTGTIFAPLSLARSLTITANVFLALDGRGDVTADDVRSHLAPIDAAVRVTHVQRVEDALSESIRTRRISAFAASSFAIGAIALVAIGLFGLVAQTAGWRTREMGIRVALGGTPAGIVRLVVGEQVGAVLGGLVAGGLLAAAAARFVGAYLYGVTPYDVRTWSVALVVVLATAALGALVPAARASRTDPIVALRTD